MADLALLPTFQDSSSGSAVKRTRKCLKQILGGEHNSRIYCHYHRFQTPSLDPLNNIMHQLIFLRFAPAYGGFSVLGVANEVAPGYKWSRTFMGPAVSVSAARILGGRHVIRSRSLLTEQIVFHRGQRHQEQRSPNHYCKGRRSLG